MLKCHNVGSLGLVAVTQPFSRLSPLERLFEYVYITDPFPTKILRLLQNHIKHSSKITLADCSMHNGLLTYRSQLYISNDLILQLHLLKEYGDAPSAENEGRA